MIIEREFSENDFLNDKSFLLKLVSFSYVLPLSSYTLSFIFKGLSFSLIASILSLSIYSK